MNMFHVWAPPERLKNSPKEMEIAPENQSLKTLKINHWTIEYHLSDLFLKKKSKLPEESPVGPS